MGGPGSGALFVTDGNGHFSNTVRIVGHRTILHPKDVVGFVSTNESPPIMSAFLQGKPLEVASSFVSAAQRSWTVRIAAASRVGIIGVRPNADDTHIWGPLAATKAELVVIGNESEYEAWAGECRGGRPLHVVGHYFEDGLDPFIARLVG